MLFTSKNSLIPASVFTWNLINGLWKQLPHYCTRSVLCWGRSFVQSSKLVHNGFKFFLKSNCYFKIPCVFTRKLTYLMKLKLCYSSYVTYQGVWVTKPLEDNEYLFTFSVTQCFWFNKLVRNCNRVINVLMKQFFLLWIFEISYGSKSDLLDRQVVVKGTLLLLVSSCTPWY